MWPKVLANKILRKALGSNNFVADFQNFTGTMLDTKSSSQENLSSNKCFIDQDTYNIFVGSWNVGGIVPSEDLDMEDWLDTHNPAEIYVLGFQEIVPLNAGNILASENRKISMRWNNIISQALNKAILTQAQDNKEEDEYQISYQMKNQSSAEYRKSKDNFQCIISKQMVGIFVSAWVRSDIYQHIQHPRVSCIGCGIMGCLGNKGSVSVRFCLRETSFCFVCSHLASGGKEGDERHRNADAAEILSRTRFPRGPLRNLPKKILDHEIYLPEATTRSLVQKREWNALLENDQLKAEFMKGHVFQGWHEGVIEFAPTYKYYPNSGIYYGCHQKKKGEKRRAPAWCDRIIWFGEGLKQIKYDRAESRLSDHRPIQAIFTAEIEVLSDSKGLGTCLSEGFDCSQNHFKDCPKEKYLCNKISELYTYESI
ncbi:type IV inositol polyphosphate 5-phosphatase 9-like isoform X2 [Tripterygium wilfordii]|uniref:type IV inositol polyphosphate 5-phosphatase 9-like isoform X2 n=1 Tax=Tripterygium wilfordii TaxID=458696 RepID=UPI0018F7FB7C|nr:type IV inositol polyphosphate 5-phosphatase 9-like isoform X2 [Tripterygium wilfordii]